MKNFTVSVLSSLSLVAMVSGCSIQQVDKNVKDVASSSFSSTSSADNREPMMKWKTYTHQSSGLQLRYPPDWELQNQTDADFVMIFSPGKDPSSMESSVANVRIWFQSHPRMDHETHNVSIAGKQAMDTGWYERPGGDIYSGGNRDRYIQIQDPLVTIALLGGNPGIDSNQKNEKLMETILATISFEKTVTETSNKPSVAYSSSVIASRPICSSDDFQNDPRLHWNRDPATSTVTLTRPEKGISVLIPYNSAWGSTYCQQSPFDENAAGIVFGPSAVLEGRGEERWNALFWTSPRSASQAVEAIHEQLSRDHKEGRLTTWTDPHITTIGKNIVVQYDVGTMCDQTEYEVIGKKFNYQIHSFCNVDSDALIRILESLQVSE